MSRKIKVVIYQEDDQWVAQALNVEVSSFGATPEEARDAIQEALELYFEDAPASDTTVPVVRHGRIEDLVI
jgi:predicted RNase H-like HicB family nuclease